MSTTTKHSIVTRFEEQVESQLERDWENQRDPFAEFNAMVFRRQLEMMKSVAEDVTEWKSNGPESPRGLEDYLIHWAKNFNRQAWTHVERAINGGSTHFMSKVEDLAAANAYREISQQLDEFLAAAKAGGKGYLEFHVAHRL